jgi:hypothetical protein
MASIPRQDRRQKAETILTEVAGQSTDHFLEIGAHHYTKVESARRRGGHGVREPIERSLGVVAPDDRLESGFLHRHAGVELTKQKTSRCIARPRDGIQDIVLAKHQVVSGELAACCEDPMHLGIEGGALVDVHHHVLQKDRIERRVLERQTQGIADLKPNVVLQPAATREVSGCIDKGRAQIDARHRTAECGGQIARRAADATAEIQHAG